MRSKPVNKCLCCQFSGELIYEAIQDRSFGVAGSWDIRRCLNPECGFLWLDPAPVEEDIGLAYKTYFTHPKQLDAGKQKKSIFFLPLRFLRVFFNKLTLIDSRKRKSNNLYLDDLPPGKLLDIGCGNGERLARMRSIGWSVEGQDVDPKAVSFGRQKFNLKIHSEPLLSLVLPSESYDVIIMNHVIEHLLQPAAILKECHRLLRQGGRLVVVTPNADSFAHKYFGASWIGLDPPRHLHLFSLRTIEQLAALAGFRNLNTFSTSINADVFAAGSFSIRKSGHYDMNAEVRISPRLKAVAFLYFTIVLGAAIRSSGEECVLVAAK